MYYITIMNDTTEKVLHTGNMAYDGPKILEGKFENGIGTVDPFDFKIFSDHPCYNELHPLKTLVNIKNLNTNQMEYEGRVFFISPEMDSDGKVFKNIKCESELGFLNDSSGQWQEFSRTTPRNLLRAILSRHNSQVEAFKRFEVGNVTIAATEVDCELDYVKTLQLLKSKLIEPLGGELSIRKVNGVRYLDWLQQVGSSDPKTEIRLAKNLKSLRMEIDPSNVITRLIPLGSKIEDSQQRVTIASVNNDRDYIEDAAMLASFGNVTVSEIWDDVNSPRALRTRGQAFLRENNRVKVSYSVSALDLSKVGLDINSYQVATYTRLVNPLMKIDTDLRIIKKTTQVDQEHLSQLTIGDKFETANEYRVRMQRQQEMNLSEIRNRSTMTATGGLVKSGNVIRMANSGVAVGTYSKVTVNEKGVVTAAANLTTQDLNTYSRSEVDTRIINATSSISGTISLATGVTLAPNTRAHVSKNTADFCHISMHVNLSNRAANTVVGTVPLAYRPAAGNIIRLAGQTFDSDTANRPCLLHLLANGNIILMQAGFSNLLLESSYRL